LKLEKPEARHTNRREFLPLRLSERGEGKSDFAHYVTRSQTGAELPPRLTAIINEVLRSQTPIKKHLGINVFNYAALETANFICRI
jgi:hypothetical protein